MSRLWERSSGESAVVMTLINLRNYTNGDRLTVTLESGETFDGVVSDRDGDSSDTYGKGWVRITFEGDLWEQVNDRVDSEVLELRQDFSRVRGDPQTPELYGHIWPEDSVGDPEYVKLGNVAEITT